MGCNLAESCLIQGIPRRELLQPQTMPFTVPLNLCILYINDLHLSYFFSANAKAILGTSSNSNRSLGMTKIALITGANKGIGLETARQLAQQGIHVLIGARDAANGQAAAQTLQSAGYKADFIALDVSNEASVKQAAQIVTRYSCCFR
jgi:short chain dehydrogenase